MDTRRNLLLTGHSGAGKSRLLEQVIARLTSYRIRGFVSRAILTNGERAGWRLDGFTGLGGVFIHRDLESRTRFRDFRVNLDLLERLVESELGNPCAADLHVIDEIGPVCSMSDAFVSATTRLLDSGALVVGTVHRSAAGFPERVRDRDDVDLLDITDRAVDAATVETWITRRSA